MSLSNGGAVKPIMVRQSHDRLNLILNGGGEAFVAIDSRIRLGEFLFDPSPICQIAYITFRQSQDGTKMIARQNYCINSKRPALAAFANGSA